MAAQITLWRTNGINHEFNPPSITNDTERGLRLLSAVNAAQAGDMVLVGPGVNAMPLQHSGRSPRTVPTASSLSVAGSGSEGLGRNLHGLADGSWTPWSARTLVQSTFVLGGCEIVLSRVRYSSSFASNRPTPSNDISPEFAMTSRLRALPNHLISQ